MSKGGRYHRKGDKYRNIDEKQKKSRRAANSALIEEGLRQQRAKASEEAAKSSQLQAMKPREENKPKSTHRLVLCQRFPLPNAISHSAILSTKPYHPALLCSLSTVLHNREVGLHYDTYYRYKSNLWLRNRHLLSASVHCVAPPFAPGSSQVNLNSYGSSGAVITTHNQGYIYDSPLSNPTYSFPLSHRCGEILKSSVGHHHNLLHICTLSGNNYHIALHSARQSLGNIEVTLVNPVQRSHSTILFQQEMDFTSLLSWNKAADGFYVTSKAGINETRLDSREKTLHAFSVEKSNHITALCNNTFNNGKTVFIGTRSGTVHLVDFRQSPRPALNVLSYHKDSYYVNGLECLQDNQLIVGNAFNAVSVIDTRYSRSPLKILQKGTNNCMSKGGFSVTPDRKLIVTRYQEKPLKLAFYSNDNGFEPAGDPVDIKVNGEELLKGKMQFANRSGSDNEAELGVGSDVMWFSYYTPVEGHANGSMDIFALGSTISR